MQDDGRPGGSLQRKAGNFVAGVVDWVCRRVRRRRRAAARAARGGRNARRPAAARTASVARASAPHSMSALATST